MRTINQIIKKLSECNITVSEYKEDNKLCGYELNTYTDGGVNEIIFLDFRGTALNPKIAKDFIEVFNQWVKDFDIDETIDKYRQDERYKQVFSLSNSVIDFTDWRHNMEAIFKQPKTAQQRQFEQTKDKFTSLLAEMEETLKLMPRKGNTPSECQRTNISNHLGGLDMAINGIELEDFTPNDYSNDFKLSYS